jgi:hypothetical protein|nr:MAG TPA: protein of unknown function DUF1424 [Caudoviricetes sp.]
MGYYEKRIQSGPYLEVYRYHALRSPGKQTPRGPVERDTTEYQEELNSVAAWKKLFRLELCNFSRAAGDLFVTVTHRERITEADALREERNLIARLKRLRKRLGLSDLKYIAVTEEQGRWHTHLILNGGLTLEQLVKVWGDRGRVAVSTLEDQNNYRELARYLTADHKECRRKTDEHGDPALKTPRRKYQRRWHASRNLARPVEKVKPAPKPRMGEPKPPKGYRLLPDWRFGVDVLGYYYVDYACMAEKWEPKEPKKPKKGNRSEPRPRTAPKGLPQDEARDLKGGGPKKGDEKNAEEPKRHPARADGKRGTTAALPVGADGGGSAPGAESALPHSQRGEAERQDRGPDEGRGAEKGRA